MTLGVTQSWYPKPMYERATTFFVAIPPRRLR